VRRDSWHAPAWPAGDWLSLEVNGMEALTWGIAEYLVRLLVSLVAALILIEAMALASLGVRKWFHAHPRHGRHPRMGHA
jgi:hypothetical protein